MCATQDDASGPYAAGLRSLDLTILILSLLVLIAAFLLGVEETRVRLAVWPGWLLPESCLSRSLAGIDCPGCGLTRSFVYLAEGDVSGSLASNRVGWLLALATLSQIPIRLWSLWKTQPLVSHRLQTALGATLIALLIVNWLWNMMG